MTQDKKTDFYNWLKAGNTKKYAPDFCVRLLETVAAVALEKHYAKISLFEIIDIKHFNEVKRKVINNRKLIFAQKDEHIKFDQVGALYAKFLAGILENKIDQEVVRIALKDNPDEEIIKDNSPANIESFCWENTIEAFLAWMNNKVSENTRRNYYNNVKKLINDNEQEWNEASRLSSPIDIVTNFFLRLSASIDFQEDNRLAHNQYSAALNKLIEFMNGDNIKMAESTRSSLKSQSLVPDEIRDNILKVLSEKFKGGYRLNDYIDFERLKHFYFDITGEDFYISEEITNKAIALFGVKHNGKVYIIRKEGEEKLRKLLEDAKKNGFAVIYYGAFYYKNSDFFNELGIYDEGQVKELLKTICSDLFYKSSYFAFTNDATPYSEVKRCFDNCLLTCKEEIAETLIYLTIDDVENILDNNEGFINNGDGRYIFVDKIYIPEDEQEQLFSEVKNRVQHIGYCPVKDLAVSGLKDWNPDVSTKAIQAAVCLCYLNGEYERKGTIIVKKGSGINATAIIKNYCLSRKTFTLTDITELETELRGVCHSQALFWALEVSVRIDGEMFVNDSEISFNVEEIDNALNNICHGEFVPLKNVKDIYSLPHIDGYRWNLFLLKSYVKRFSKIFEYKDLATNSANCGAIIRRSARYEDYFQVMAAALINSGVSFENDAANAVLVRDGYIFKASIQIERVIAEARKRREVQ